MVGVVSRFGGTVTEVDVESDDALIRDFSLRIPVVLDPSGEVVAEGIIDHSDLKRRVRAWSRRHR